MSEKYTYSTAVKIAAVGLLVYHAIQNPVVWLVLVIWAAIGFHANRAYWKGIEDYRFDFEEGFEGLKFNWWRRFVYIVIYSVVPGPFFLTDFWDDQGKEGHFKPYQRSRLFFRGRLTKED